MFFELIATFVAGIGVAGLVLILNRLTGKRLPGGAVPVAAGVAMIAFAIWSEMTWAGRTVAALPEGIKVVQIVEERIRWKPWTYIIPQATRFVTVDRTTIRQNPAAPATKLVNLYFYARWQPVSRVPQLIDCVNHARADATQAAISSPAEDTHWLGLDENDPLIRSVCDDS